MGLATMKAAFQSIGEAWTIAGKAWNAGKNNLEDIPFLAEGRIPFTMTDKWKNVGAVIEKQGTTSEKMMYNLTSILYDFNNWIGVKYPMTAMGAIDAGTNVIMGRMEAKLRAFSEAWDETGGKVNKDLIQKYEQKFRDEIFDHQKQMIKSDYATRMADEAGLKLPLDGKTLGGLVDLDRTEKYISSNPALRPFFMFMRTGYNALELVQKHTPILARFNEEVSDVLRATPDELDSVLKYGITSPAHLMEAQAVMRGRIACGYLTVGSAIGTERCNAIGHVDAEQVGIGF
ncbi:MAG: Cyanophage, partial [Pseudomonadota bacterium]